MINFSQIEDLKKKKTNEVNDDNFIENNSLGVHRFGAHNGFGVSKTDNSVIILYFVCDIQFIH